MSEHSKNFCYVDFDKALVYSCALWIWRGIR